MRRTGAAAVAVVMLLSAACAQEADQSVATHGSEGALALLQGAPDAAAEAGTQRFEMVMEMSMPGVGEVTVVATGAADYSAQLVAMEMDMSDMLDQLGDAGQPAPFDELTMEAIISGDAFYMRTAMFGDRWVKASFEDLMGVSGDDLFAAQGINDPTAFLQYLRGSGTADVVGEEQVRGVDTVHYVAEVAMADSLQAAPEEQRAALERLLEGVPFDALDQPFDMDVWIGDDGLVRRVQMDMGEIFSDVPEMGGTEMSVTIEMFDYGDPVDIDVPDDSETTSFEDLLGG